MAISIDKSKFSCKQVEWLGYVINEYGTNPMQRKAEVVLKHQYSKTFKKLKSFMGLIRHLNKFIPNLDQLCTPLRPLLSTTVKYHFTWEPTHEKAFKNMLEAVHNVTETRQFVSG